MQQYIIQLLKDVQVMQEKFEAVKQSEIDYDFYSIVIPFAEHIDNTLNVLAKYESQILQLQYMNKKKFDLLISNIESLSVECHFKRTSRKLFTEKIKAVQYDLTYIQRNE